MQRESHDSVRIFKYVKQNGAQKASLSSNQRSILEKFKIRDDICPEAT